jgi:hypothetical protein
VVSTGCTGNPVFAAATHDPPARKAGVSKPQTAAQGAAEKIKRENDVYLRQLAKKSTYLLFIFFNFF